MYDKIIILNQERCKNEEKIIVFDNGYNFSINR